MSTQPADPLLESLVNDFGGNYAFALDVLEQYRHDRRSVEASWREYFDRQLGVAPEPVPEAAPEPSPIRTLVRQDAPAVPARDKSRAVAIPAILPGDIAEPIRGGAVRIVENMEASLQIPTATSEIGRASCRERV